MNIQVCCPYQKCVYNCPMCIAKGHKHNYKFSNNTNSQEYYDNLSNIIEYEQTCDVILTGECDPSQNMQWVKKVLTQLKDTYFSGSVELQTRNYNIDVQKLEDLDLGVLSYSIVYLKDYLKSHSFNKLRVGINRLVILLTKEFEFLNKDTFNTMGFNQVTFKTLQYGEDKNVNKWIDENKMSEDGVNRIREIIEFYNGSKECSVRLDENCQDATNRYYIYRSDGKLYKNWEEENALEINRFIRKEDEDEYY